MLKNAKHSQKLLTEAGITKIADLRTRKHWETAATLSEETGIESVRLKEWLL